MIRLVLRLLLLADCAVCALGTGALFAYLQVAHLEPAAREIAPGVSISAVLVFLASTAFIGVLIHEWWPPSRLQQVL